jgi:hypothetical protein
LWAVLLVIVLAVLATLFGGFQKGTKTGSLGFISGRAMAVCCVAENAGRLYTGADHRVVGVVTCRA